MRYSFAEWKKSLLEAEVKALAILSFPAIQLLDIEVGDLISDSGIQARAMTAVGERLPGQAALVSMMDLSLEAEAFGASVNFSAHEVPTIRGRRIHNRAEAEQMSIPGVREGRCGIYIDAIRQVMEQNPDRPVFAGVIGPFSLAGRLMDVSEIMIQCMMDPDYVRLVIRKAADFLKSYIRAYKEIGANGVILAEPLAGLLSPDWLKEFSSVYIREICEELQEDSFSILYHNCGPNTVLAVDEILFTGCAAYHLGNAVRLAEILEKVGRDTIVMGNLDPVKYFKDASREEMAAAVRELCEECASYANFVISSGCDIPPMASWDNIEQFFTSVKEYNERWKSL